MADDKHIAVKVEHLTKSFQIPLEAHSGIKQKMINTLKGRKGYRTFTPLKDISFTIEEGDFFGIVGRNGSGKSTLLKTLAGIYAPNKGGVHINGTLVPFIELGVGFNPELTGRENVYLNGALLGFSHKQMDAMYDDIVEFAELGDFMEERLKNYSSGMQVRLAFSIAIRADGDILLLDEVLAVGDEAFQRKCYTYFAELKRKKKTVVLVTHSMESVQQFCTKAMMIEKGEIIESGNPAKVAQRYSELFLTASEPEENPDKKKDKKSKKIAQNDAFTIEKSFNKTVDKLNFAFSITPKKDFENPAVGMYISRDNGEIIWKWASDYKIESNKTSNILIKKNTTQHINIQLDNILPDGTYAATLVVRKQDMSEHYAIFADIIQFNNYTSSQYDKQWKMNARVETRI